MEAPPYWGPYGGDEQQQQHEEWEQGVVLSDEGGVVVMGGPYEDPSDASPRDSLETLHSGEAQLEGPRVLPVWKQLPQIARAPCVPGGAPFEPSCASWDPLGGLLCVGSIGGSICTFDPSTAYPCTCFPLPGGAGGPPEGPGAVCSLLPLHSGILSVCLNGVLLVRRGGLPVPLLSAVSQQQLLQCCGAFSQGTTLGPPAEEAPYALIGGQLPVACLLDLCTGTLLSSYATQSPVSALPAGPAAAAAAAAVGLLPIGCADGMVRLLDTRMGALVSEVLPLVSPLSVSCLSFAGTQLAACGALLPGHLGSPRGLKEALRRCCFLDLRLQAKTLASVSLFPSSLPLMCLLSPGLEETHPLAVAVSSDGCVLQADVSRLSLLPPYSNSISSCSSSGGGYAEALAAGALEAVPFQTIQRPLACAALDTRSSLLALCECGGLVQLMQQQQNRQQLGDPLARHAAVLAATKRQQQQLLVQQGTVLESSSIHSNSSSSTSCRPLEEDLGELVGPLPGLDDFLLPPTAAAAETQHLPDPSPLSLCCSSYLQQQQQLLLLGVTLGGPLREACAVEELREEYQLLDSLRAPRVRGPLIMPCCCTCVRPGSCSGGPLLKGVACCCDLLSEKWVYPVSSLLRDDGDTCWGPSSQGHWGALEGMGGAGAGASPIDAEGYISACAAEDPASDLVCGMLLRSAGAPGGAPCYCSSKRSTSKPGDSRCSSGYSGYRSVFEGWDGGPFGGLPEDGSGCLVEVLTEEDTRPPIPFPLALLRGTESAGGWQESSGVRFAANVFGCGPNGALYGPIGSSRELVLRKTGGLLAARGGEGPFAGAPLRRSELLAIQTLGAPKTPPWADACSAGGPSLSGGAASFSASVGSRGGYGSRRGRWGPPGGPPASVGATVQHKPPWKGKGDSSGICLSPSSSSASGDSDEDEAPTRHARALLRASRQQRAPEGAPPRRRSVCNSSDLSSPRPSSPGGRLPGSPKEGPSGGPNPRSGSSKGTVGRAPLTSSLGAPMSLSHICNRSARVPSRYALHRLTGAPWMCASKLGGPPSVKLPPFGCFEGGGRRGLVRPLLQLLFFFPALKEALSLHACERGFCVACEVGNVLHMLELARRDAGVGGRRFCHSNGFESLLFEVPEARLLGLYKKIGNNRLATLLHRTQATLRFLLERLHKEMRSAATAGGPPAPPVAFPVPFRALPKAPPRVAAPQGASAENSSSSAAEGSLGGAPGDPAVRVQVEGTERGEAAEKASSVVEALFAFQQQTETVCLLHQHSTTQMCESFIVDLQYISRAGLPGGPHGDGPLTAYSSSSSSSSYSSSCSSKQGCFGSPVGACMQTASSSESGGRGASGAFPSSPGLRDQRAGFSSTSAAAAAASSFLLPPRAGCGNKAEGATGDRGEPASISFCELLQHSLKRRTARMTYCKGCGANVDCGITIRATSLPLFLLLHANAQHQEDFLLWRSVDSNGRGFLRRRFWLRLTANDIEVRDEEGPGFVRYDLISSLFAVRPVEGATGSPGVPGGGPQCAAGLKALPVRSFAKATSAEKAAKHAHGEDGGCHLVLQVRIPAAYNSQPVTEQQQQQQELCRSSVGSAEGSRGPGKRRGVPEGPWVAINDFVLSYVRPRAVLDFVSPWKYPCLLCFAREDAEQGDAPLFSGFHTDVAGGLKTTDFVRDSGDRLVPIPRVLGCPVSVDSFLSEQNLSLNPDAPREPTTFQSLTPNELLLMQTTRLRREECLNGLASAGHKGLSCLEGFSMGLEGYIVAVDAEFVAEVTEAAEIDEQGHKHVLQSSSLALARLSLVRGQGPLEGIPFMDHYVQFKRPPKDCLTRFSGLRLEDLNVNESRVWLTTRKAILQKLRYLIDAGCIFVGHGLQHDFRVINLYVPSDQVIDTVELYRLPGKRFLSLKFLAAFVLQQSIQGATHDSIEDAQTALRLFKKYLVMKKDGSLAGCIAKLYEMGYHTNWTAPNITTPLACACATSAPQAVAIFSEDTRAKTNTSRRNSNSGSHLHTTTTPLLFR